MFGIYKTIDGKISRSDGGIEPGCWINLCYPTEGELELVAEGLGIETDCLRAALDEEETSRIEAEDSYTLVIIDIPMVEKGEAVNYSTLPLGIIITEDNIVTVCLRDTPVIEDFAEGRVRGATTVQKSRFMLLILLRFAGMYLQYLKQIDKISDYTERQLYRAHRNKELIRLLELEKSLVYFSTSLKGNEVTLSKILRGRTIKLYEDDQDILEDVLVEIHQAIEMANIYSSILSGMMDAYASVISNNLNMIMKVLTSITILLTIPNIIFSFYGMNVQSLPLPFAWFPFLLSAALVGLVAFILKKQDLF